MTEPDPLRFRVNLAGAQPHRDLLAAERDALETKISYILDNMVINGAPILRFILSLSRDPEVLEQLGACCSRLAPYLRQAAGLDAKLAVLDVAVAEPTFLAWAFGDFSEEFGQFLASFGGDDHGPPEEPPPAPSEEF